MAKPPPRVTGKLSKKNVTAALESTGGVQSIAAEMLGVNKSSLTRYLDKHPDLRLFAQEQKETILDFAESHIMLAVKRGDWQACKYWADNFGQSRGYGARKLAFRDGEGVLNVPAVLVTGHRMTDEEWDKEFGHLGDPPAAE